MANPALQIAAATGVVAAFSTAVLMPAIKVWNDLTVLWWLCYIVTVATAVGSARPQLHSLKKLAVSLFAAFMPLLYIGLNVFVLGRTMQLSGLKSSNPEFWRIVAAIAVGSWIFTWLFSHSKSLFAAATRWVVADATEAQVAKVSRVIAALIGLVGALGLLARAFFAGQE